ncbi:hypothetical protein [aff. Roholtiella sp. LEGE 12411]|uniref:hypothetical protein n=1 Tax=aff. Roholtiella sp. LEGE 12411 TaxID=1828822 RepID=UPI00187EF11B|nr:hypothetical protein [aff. Roholtiella sp. LEGE 12411]MBE9038612.1 hypothetical protein [aff. Roholtiella sp. LEGE 12411]
MWKLKIYLWIANRALKAIQNDPSYLQMREVANRNSTVTIRVSVWGVEDLSEYLKGKNNGG